jgi:hypothetical protein
MSTSTTVSTPPAGSGGTPGAADGAADFWRPESLDLRPALTVAAPLACLALTGVMVGVIVHPALNPLHIASLPLIAIAWAAFAAAAWLLRKVTAGLAIGMIIAGGIALQVVAISAPPATSPQEYRAMWDGRVQAAGTDPYLYPPDAAAVAGLRDDFLWSPAASDAYRYCPLPRVSEQGPAFDQIAGCTKISLPGAPASDPPAAEAYFLGVHLAAPADDAALPLQAAGAACATLTTLVVLLGLRRAGKSPRLAALWAWCPAVALEASNNAHVDALAAALTAIALLLLSREQSRGRAIAGGALIGLAIAARLTPVLVVPGVIRRAWQQIAIAAGAAIVIVYAPYALVAGGRVFSGFPRYLTEQGYSGGAGFGILALAVPGKLATVVAVIALAAVALAIVKFGDPAQPWRGGVLMTAAALAIATPRFPSYALLLVMLVALDGRPEWLALPAGAYLASDAHLTGSAAIPHAPVAGYAAGAIIAGTLALVRLRRSPRGMHANPPGPLTSAASARNIPARPEGPAKPPGPSGGPPESLEAALASSLRLAKTEVGSIPQGIDTNPPDPLPPRGADRRSFAARERPPVAGGSGGGTSGASGDTKEGAQVIEPTAVYKRPIITIGWDGTPAFGKAEPDEE